MDGLISSGQKRSYEDFKKQLSPSIISLFDVLRDYCFSLGKNVIEDIRMHRIVFCKSFSFRFFADMEPDHDSITIKIQKGRSKPQKIIKVKPNQNLNEIKNLLSEAYNTIR
ncbi:MAG: hypothetical protein ACE5JT_03560 [Nitrosopumilaceae archaeon]